MEIYRRLGVPCVINALGYMTSKENMAGLLAGVERYVSGVKEQVDAHRRRINAVLMGRVPRSTLANGNPPVRARPHLMSLGELGFDCRIMTEDDAREVVRQVRAFYRSQEVVGRRAALPPQ